MERHFTQRALHTPEITPDKEAASVKAIEEDIKFGRLPPGMRLVEDPLMSRFAVTPHVIRRALAKLERTGIIVREKNKGAAVRSLTPLEVQQIYDVRELLQRQAALLIRLPAPVELIEDIEQIQAEYCRHVLSRHFRGVHELNPGCV